MASNHDVTIEDFHLPSFVRQYVTTALWSSCETAISEDGQERETYNLDDRFTWDDLAPSTWAKAEADCRSFIAQCIEAGLGEVILGESLGDKQSAHDFWLTRNRHGAGFWDGDYPEHGDRLTAISHSFGEADWYSGDDGLIYQTGAENYGMEAA